MGIFRSEDIQLYQMTVPKDDAWHTVNEVGKLDCVHFIDLNIERGTHEQKYINTVKRIEELQRKIENILIECERHEISSDEPQSAQDLEVQIQKLIRGRDEQILLDQIENDVYDKEKFVQQQIQQIKDIHHRYNYLTGYKNALSNAQAMLSQVDDSHLDGQTVQGPSQDDENNEEVKESSQLIRENDDSGAGLAFKPIVGTIDRKEQMRLKKLVFRTSRGNAFVQFFDIKEKLYSYSGEEIDLIIYFVVVPADSNYSRKRLQLLCDSFNGEKYQLPNTKRGIIEALKQTKKDLQDLYRNLGFTLQSFKDYLGSSHKSDFFEGYSLLKVYSQYLKKTKANYLTLNKFKQDTNLLIGLYWVSSKNAQKVISQFSQDENRIGRQRAVQIKQIVDHKLVPPTFFEINEFVWPFHEIVVTYGTPNYKEANPTTFNMVTFPFLFGVMFGDIGHGFMLFAFASWLCLAKDDLMKYKELFWLLKARYLLLLMGFFATYCGFIYNDMMSVPLNLFGTCYTNVDEYTVEAKADCIYPFGIDPKWYVTPRELNFLNSFKMKLAVIYGVMQMSLGIFLKASNNIYERKPIDFFFEFLPQIIFLWCLFGFMDLLIILKWLTDYSGRESEAPSVIVQMINMFLNGGKVDGSPLIGSEEQQTMLQQCLVIICLMCVPFMLFVKPIHEYNKHKHHRKEEPQSVQNQQKNNEEEEQKVVEQEQQQKQLKHDQDDEDQDIIEEDRNLIETKGKDIVEVEDDWWQRLNEVEEKKQKPHEFSDIFIHQMIETIEFVLGTISNTASYLRLWALSLAHGQLSAVFFEKTIGMSLEMNSITLMVIGFMIFAGITLFVLMFMDVLECCLHDLRLHWVEFQNKFYKGQGYKFVAFSHESLLFPNKLN